MKQNRYIIYLPVLLMCISSCKKFVEIPPPRTELIKSTVFESDATANAAMIDIYYQLSLSGFASGDILSFSYIGSYSCDEQKNYSIPEYQQFNDNQILPDNSINLKMWSDLYTAIYKANSILEGISGYSAISVNLKNQLEGEAKFIRAFCHFYLLNLWGEIPLITTSDYQTNSQLPRASRSEIYTQVIKDLKDAQNLLPGDYSFANNERIRANKWAATAFLARVFLFTQDWTNAETEASKIIQMTSQYSLVPDLSLVFRKNSLESIWQFQTTYIDNDFFTFRVTGSGPNTGALRNDFVNSFESGDLRRTTWIRSRTNNNVLYYYPGKYISSNIAEDYSTVFRLAEQYLIRAEARTHLNNFSGAQSDINVIRNRAGLSNTSASTQADLLTAIENERKWELFTEWGHRWLDLKRTGRAAAVLAPIKGSSWQATDTLYPIPDYQIRNSTLTQNPGY